MGRPRSLRAHDAVLEAAATLFALRGLDATSMDAIADASGVSKATIYKHWPDKGALCLEMLSHTHGYDARMPDPDTGDLRTDLLAVLTYEPPPEHADLRSKLMPHLMAYAARNPAFTKAWRARVLEPPRQLLARVLNRAVERGLLPAMDTNLAAALLLGPPMYGHVMKMIDGPVPTGVREVIVDMFLNTYAIAPAARRAR